jgi:enamine deaminase RidA (YjgF/YER057c/UK114 family)
MIMTAKNTKNARPSSAPRKATASRREFVAGAVTMAAAAGASTGAPTNAQAQTPTNLRFFNPPGMSNPPGYSHVVEVTGPHRTVYFAGQTGADANGKVSKDFREQAIQVFENIKIALASVGAGFEHVVKVTAYHTDLATNAAIYREVRAMYFKNKAALPGHTLLQISRLANPVYQLELEFIAILPPKG